jgi:membrane-associated phospholipid phosphatase
VRALAATSATCVLSISSRPSTPLFFTGTVVDTDGQPVAGAEIDVWHASPVGLYENQDPEQAEWNLRGKFFTDDDGVFSFRSVKPSGYPIPTGGPVGDLLTALKRHPFRPAHVHAMVYKPGFKTITSQIYSHDDPMLDTDAQFGVTRARSSPRTCGTRPGRAGAGPGRHRALVHPRLHLRRRAGGGLAADAAGLGQGRSGFRYHRSHGNVIVMHGQWEEGHASAVGETIARGRPPSLGRAGGSRMRDRRRHARPAGRGQTGPDGFDAAVDAPVIAFFGGHHGLLLWLALPATFVPATAISAATAVGCLIARRLNGVVLAVTAVPVAAVLDDALLKHLFDRTYLGQLAFPSGHTTSVTAQTALLAVLLLVPPQRQRTRTARVALVTAYCVITATVATSVIALRWHYFTDTVAGAATGAGTVLVLALLIDLARNRSPHHAPVIRLISGWSRTGRPRRRRFPR